MPGPGDEAQEPAAALPLRILLRVAVAVMLGGAVAALIWSIASGPGGGALPILTLTLILSSVAGWLFLGKQASHLAARAAELVAFGAVALYLAYAGHQALAMLLDAGEPGAALSRWFLLLVEFVLLMVAYGIFVPNSLPRAAGVLFAMAMTPWTVAAALRLGSPIRADLMARTATRGQLAESIAIVAVGALMATLAAHVIDRYFTTAFAARVATMYSLKTQIGAGGMGEVWLAEHNTLARPAAVKLIRGEVAESDPEKADMLLRRFHREAKATASLRSPHTIEVYDFGVTGEGTFYYAMEHLEGLDLRALVRDHGPLPPERAIHLLEQACESLADAHCNGMIHRDIKPANIFTCRLGTAYDFVKVLDFGLVKTEEPEPGLPELTVEGTASGTPGYMAPEMALSRPDIDGRADIYALGCVGYLLLTGLPVFEGDAPLSVLVDHVKTPPTPPSQKTDFEIPEDLEQVILKCLAKDPADRYQQADELRDALTACSTAGRWTAGRARDWWKLHLPQIAA